MRKRLANSGCPYRSADSVGRLQDGEALIKGTTARSSAQQELRPLLRMTPRRLEGVVHFRLWDFLFRRRLSLSSRCASLSHLSSFSRHNSASDATSSGLRNRLPSQRKLPVSRFFDIPLVVVAIYDGNLFSLFSAFSLHLIIGVKVRKMTTTELVLFF